jgi:hypothetical protein
LFSLFASGTFPFAVWITYLVFPNHQGNSWKILLKIRIVFQTAKTRVVLRFLHLRLIVPKSRKDATRPICRRRVDVENARLGWTSVGKECFRYNLSGGVKTSPGFDEA